MAPEEKIIEFQTVKKGRTIIFIALIAVFALASVGFLLLWILKAPGIDAGVTSIQMQGNLLQVSTDDNGNGVYVASSNVEYTVYADVSVFGDVTPSIDWIRSPSQYFVVDPAKNGIDPTNPNRFYFTFTIADDAPDGAAAQIMAKSKTSGEVTALYNFTIKAQHTAEFSIAEVKGVSATPGESKPREFSKTGDNIYSVTLPYFSSSITAADALNTNYINFTQLGVLGVNGERAKLTKGIAGTNPSYVVNAIEYEFANMSAAGVAEFDSTAGKRGIEPGSVQNADDMTSLRLLSPGTFRLKATANKYNSSDEIVLYLDVTVKDITTYDNVLSSISITEAVDLYLDESTPLDLADPSKNLISFSRPAPAGTSWNYRVYESEQDGTEIKSSAAKLIVSGTRLFPSSTPGRTFITIKDTSSNGFGASDTKPVNIYAPIISLAASQKNAVKDKGEVQRLDKLVFTATFNIFNPAGMTLAGGVGLNYTLEFTYATKAHEPVPEPGSTTRFSNAADTVTFDAMEYVRTEGNVRVYAINVSRNAANKISVSADNKSASIDFDATVGGNAALATQYSISFFTQPQSRSGINIIRTASPVRFYVRDVVTRLEFKTAADEKPTLGSDRFFAANTGTKIKQYLIMMIGNADSSYSLLDLVKFYNGSTFVANTGVLPDGVTVSPKTVFSGGESTTTYKFASSAYETNEIDIIITIKSGQSSEDFHLYLKHENTPANLNLSASDSASFNSGARVINYSSGVQSADIGLGKDSLTTQYASNSTATSTVFYTYIFANNKDNSKTIMLTHKVEGSNTGVYLSGAAGEPKLFTIRGSKSVTLETDLFALSMKKFESGDAVWGKLDNFIVVYSLIPLKPGADGLPVINTPYSTGGDIRYYDDYTYGTEKTSRLIQFRSYKAFREFDDAAFYTDNSYATPLSKYTGTGGSDTSADFSKNINVPTPFTLYPSGILKYNDGTGNVELKYEKESKDPSALLNKLNVVPLGAITGTDIIKVDGSEPNTYYILAATENAKFNVALAVNDIAGSATKSLKLIYRNDELKVIGFEFYSDSGLTTLIPSGSVISLINGASADVINIYIKIVYEGFNAGTHVKYQNFDPLLGGVRVNPANQTGNLALINVSPREIDGSVPGGNIVESAIGVITAPELILQIEIKSNNKNGKLAFSFNNLSGNYANGSALEIDVTTVVESFDICYVANTPVTGTTEILMAAKKEGTEIVLDDKVVTTFTLKLNKETDVTASPDTSKRHFDWENAVISIFDNSSAQDDITSDNTVKVKLTSSGTLTVTTNRNCYEDLIITVSINFWTYPAKVNINNPPTVVPAMGSDTLTKSFNVKISAEIYKLEFTDVSSGAALSDITIRPTGGTGTNFEVAEFGVEYNGGVEELSGLGLIDSAVATLSIKSVEDSNAYAAANFLEVNNLTVRKLQIRPGAPKVPDGVTLKLIASWTSLLGTTPVTVKKEITITVLTLNVDISLKTDYDEKYTKDSGTNIKRTTVDYYSTADLDLSLSLKNLWTGAEEAASARYSINYLAGVLPTQITQVGSKFKNLTNNKSTASFIVTATVDVLNQGQPATADVTHTLIITVRLYYRATAIEATTALPGQEGNPALTDPIKVKLVKGYTFDLKNYFHLINTSLEAGSQTDVWSQNFKVSVASGGDEFISVTGTKITVIKDGGTDIAVTLTADQNENDKGTEATRVLRITTYIPDFKAVADGNALDPDIIKLGKKSVITNEAEGTYENVYAYNLFPAANTLPIKFKLDGIVAGTSVTGVSVTFPGFESLFTGTLNHDAATGVYSAAYSIGKTNGNTNLANEHITRAEDDANDANTQIFIAKLSYNADGIPVDKTLKFIITAELDDTQKQAMAVKVKENDSPVAADGKIEIGIGSVAVTANIEDASTLIANMKTAYGATVTYVLTVLGNADAELNSNIAEINGSTGVITVKADTATFRVRAELSLSGVIFKSEILLAPALPEAVNPGWTKIIVSNASKLATRLYVGKDFDNKVLVSGTNEADVSFDNPLTNQKYLFIVVDYTLANYQYYVPTPGAFKAIINGTGLDVSSAEIEHENAADKNFFYAKYLITGVGQITANGQITSKGIEYNSPAATVKFIAAKPFASTDIYASPTVTLAINVNGTTPVEIAPVVAGAFKGGITYTYTKNGDYSNFMTINDINSADGKFKFTLIDYKNIADLSKPVSGTITLHVTAKVTSGIYKDTVISQTVTVTVNPVAPPEFKKDTTALGIKSASTGNVVINDADLAVPCAKGDVITVYAPAAATGLFNVTKSAIDSDFFTFGTVSVKAYNTNDLSTQLPGVTETAGVYTYKAPDDSGSFVIIAELDVSGGAYDGVKYTVKMHVNVKPTIMLTSSAPNVASDEVIKLTFEADAYVDSAGSRMNVAFADITNAVLGEFSTPVAEIKEGKPIHTAYFRAAKGTAGGTVTLKAKAIIGGGNVFSGQSFYSDTLTINVRSTNLTVSVTNWDDDTDAGWKIDTSGARPKVVISTGSTTADAVLTAADLSGAVTLGADGDLEDGVVSIKLINGNYAGKISETDTDEITVPKGVNFAKTTFADALEVTVVKNSITYINYFTIEIEPDAAPAITLDTVQYSDVAQEGLIDLPDTAPHIYVGDTVVLTFESAHDYNLTALSGAMFLGATPTSGYGNIEADLTNKTLKFTATNATGGATLSLKNFKATIYGKSVSVTDAVEFEIRNPDPAALFTPTVTQLFTSGVHTAPITNAGGWAFTYDDYRIDITYVTALFKSVKLIEGASNEIAATDSVTSGTSVIYTTLTFIQSASPASLKLELTAADDLTAGLPVTPTPVSVKVRFMAGDDKIYLHSSSHTIEMLDLTRNAPVFASTKNELFYNSVAGVSDDAVLSVTSGVLKAMTVNYKVTSGTVANFDIINADGTFPAGTNTLRLKGDVAAAGIAPITATVTAYVTAAGRNNLPYTQTITFYPVLRIASVSEAVSAADEVTYTVNITGSDFGLSGAVFAYSYSVPEGSPHTFINNGSSNVFTYTRTDPGAKRFTATFNATLTSATGGAAIYNGRNASFTVNVNIPAAAAPSVSATVDLSEADNSGEITPVSVSVPNSEGTGSYDGAYGGSVSFALAEGLNGATGIAGSTADKGFITLNADGTFTRKPTASGGRQWVKVTVTLDSRNGYYKNTSHSTYVEIIVDPVEITFAATATTSLDFTLSAIFKTGSIYAGLTPSVAYSVDSGNKYVDDTNIVSAKTITKLPTSDGGPVRLKATLTYGGTTLEAYTTVIVESANILFTASPSSGSDMTLSAGFIGIYASYTPASKVYAVTSGGTYVDSTNINAATPTVSKKPTKTDNASTKLSVTLTRLNGISTNETFTQTLDIAVEKADVLLTVSQNAGGATSVLNIEFMGIYSSYTLSSTKEFDVDKDNLATISTTGGVTTLRKQPDEDGGNVAVTATLTYGTIPFTASQSVSVEPANVKFTMTPEGGTSKTRFTLNAAFTGIYADTDAYPIDTDGVEFESADEDLAIIDTDGITLVKLPTPAGGSAVISATLTYNSIAFSATPITVDVSPTTLKIVKIIGDEGGTDDSGVIGGSLETYYTGMFAGTEVTGVTYTSANPNLLSVTAGGVYTKKPTIGGGTAKITAAVSGFASAEVSVTVEPLGAALSAAPNGNVSLDYNEMYDLSGVETTFGVTDSSLISVVGDEDDNTAATYTHKLHKTGGTAYVTASFTLPDGGETVNLTASSDPIVVAPFMIFNNSTAGVINLALNAGFASLSSSITASYALNGTVSETDGVYDNGLIVFTLSSDTGNYGGTYVKKLSEDGGTANITITVMTTDGTFDYITNNIQVEKAEVSAAISYSGADVIVTPSLKVAVAGATAGVSIKDDGKSVNLIGIKPESVFTFTKKPTQYGGMATLTVTYTQDSVIITKDFSVYVEPFYGSLTASGEGYTGTAVLNYNTIYSSVVSAAGIEYSTEDEDLIYVDAETGGYTKKLTAVKGNAIITAIVNGYPELTYDAIVKVAATTIEEPSVVDGGLTGTITPAAISGTTVTDITVKSGSGSLLDIDFDSDTETATYTKIPSAGGRAYYTVTYSVGTVEVASKDFYITVEPFFNSFAVSGEGYTGTAAVSYNSIYSSLLTGTGGIVYSSADTGLISVAADGTYTKMLVDESESGTAQIKAVVTFNNGASGFTYYTDVEVAATTITEPSFVPDSGKNTGLVTLAVIAGVDIAAEVKEGSKHLLEIIYDDEINAWVYTMFPTEFGGTAHYTVTYANAISSMSEDFEIEVPALAELSVDSGTGAVTLTVSSLFESIIDQAAYSLEGADAGVYENDLIEFTSAGAGAYGGTYVKKLSDDGGSAKIFITLKIGENDFDYEVNVMVEKVVIVEIHTETEPDFAGEITAALKYEDETSAMDGVTVSVRFIENETLLNLSGYDYDNGKFTYTKNITQSGTAKFVIVFTRDGFSIESGEYEIEVEPFFVSFAAVDATNYTGTAALIYNSIYANLIETDGIVYSTADTNLIGLNTATGAYTKKLVAMGGVATITATVTFKDGIQPAQLAYTATVTVDAELDISIDVSDVQDSDVTATISASFKTGSLLEGTPITVTNIAVITDSENILTNESDTEKTISWIEGETDIGNIVIEITMEFGAETITVQYVITQLPDSAGFVQP